MAKILKISNVVPGFQNFKINQKNFLKLIFFIGREGGRTSNLETLNQLGRVGISSLPHIITKYCKLVSCKSLWLVYRTRQGATGYQTIPPKESC